MALIPLWRWVALRLLRGPVLVMTSLALVGVIPLLQGLRPLASPGGAVQMVAAWIFPVGCIGAAAGLKVLVSGRTFLARLDSSVRPIGELGGLLLGILFLQLPILLGALLSAAAPADLGSLLPAILTSDLHLSAVALLILALVPTADFGVSLLLAAVWLVPALCGSGAFLGRAAALFDAGASLRESNGALSTSSLVGASALLLAGYLFRTGVPRARPG
jgi:hypothetical protein